MTKRADMKRVWTLSTMLLLVVFFAGTLTGAATLDASPRFARAERISVGSSEGLGALDLSPGQRASFDAIMARHQPKADSIIQAAMNDLLILMDSMDVEVRAVLSPDQIAAFDSLRAAGPRVRAVRRTLGPDGNVIDADTIR